MLVDSIYRLFNTFNIQGQKLRLIYVVPKYLVGIQTIIVIIWITINDMLSCLVSEELISVL